METRRILVAYITRAGYTRVIARAVAQRLRDLGLSVDLADLGLSIRHPERYDAVVLACAAHLHRYARALAEWIVENREGLAARTTALVSVDRGDHTRRLFARTRWHPDRVLVLDAIDLPLLRRIVSAWRGDSCAPHPGIEWTKICAFADEVAQLARSAAARPHRRRASAVSSARVCRERRM